VKKLNEKIGLRLETARKEANLSRKALADLLETSHTSVARWEQGAALPSFALPIISKATNRPLEYFLLEDHELSESKLQSAKMLAEIIDQKDTQIDKLERKIKNLEAALEGASNLDHALEILKDEELNKNKA